jgi:UDP-glucose 4-epimerase
VHEHSSKIIYGYQVYYTDTHIKNNKKGTFPANLNTGRPLMSKKTSVLVTGGAGFIGSHLVDQLINDGYNVRVIDNLSTGRKSNIQQHIDNGKLDFIEGDIKDKEQVKQVVSGMDAIVHLAAVTSVPFSVQNPKLTYETNVAGTLNLLASLAKERVGKFVFASTCAVYGDPQSLPVNENTPTKPISPYAESKLLAEHYCLGFHQNRLLKSVVLRFFNVYGLRQGLNDYSGVITRFVDRVKMGQPLIVYGDGSQTRDFIHVSDIVNAIQFSLEKEAAEGQVFNVGSGKATSIDELAKTILALSNADLKVIHEAARQGDIKESYSDPSKALKLLNYKPKTQLQEGLREILLEG